MTLSDYLKSLTKDGLVSFAAGCSTTPGQLKQVAIGSRRAGEKLAINIERESGGAIKCEELRPDVDWAYIRNTGQSEQKAA